MNLSYRNKQTASALSNIWKKPLDKTDWFKINDQADSEEVEILIYDVIGWPWLDANMLVNKMQDLKGRPLNFAINSPGGDLIDAIAINQAMRRHDAKVSVRIDSLAASSASIIAAGGQEVNAYKTSTFMMHNPWLIAIGNKFSMQEAADLLKKFGSQAVDLYSEKASIGKREIQSLMDGTDKRDGTWLTAAEAKEKGFIDNIIEGKSVKAKFNLSVFAGVPDEFTGKDNPDVRTVEKALRDVGVSQQKAKEVLSRCKDLISADSQRDVDGDGLDECIEMLNSITII